MDKHFQIKKRFSSLMVLLSVLLVAFDSKDHFVELSQLVNGRDEAKFRKSDNNILTELKAGTRGEILESVKFQKSHNYGIKIKVLDGKNSGNFFWVYYNVEKQNMKFFTHLPDDSRTVPTNEVSDAKTSQLTQDTNAIAAKPPKEIPKEIKVPQEKTPNKETALSSDRKLISAEDFNTTTNKESQELADNIPQKLDHINEQVAKLSPANKNQSCSSCEIKTPNNCTARNSYIEQDLIEFQLQGSSFLQNLTTPFFYDEGKEGIDLRCVRANLESFPPKNFRKCVPSTDSSSQLRAVKADKPCVTDRLASTLTKAFNVTAKCLQPVIGAKGDYKYKLQKIFEMISIESGFHTNVVGSDNDIGIGQLQNSAVSEINKIIIDQAKTSLRTSQNEDCKDLYNEFLQNDGPIEGTNICNRMAPTKGNPWKNMIYTFLYFKLNRDILDDLIFNQNLYKNSLHMPTRELEKLKDEMAKWAHNRGAGGAADILGVHLLRNFNSSFPARTAREVLYPLTNSKSNYLKQSAAKAATIESTANLSKEESCIRGY